MGFADFGLHHIVDVDGQLLGMDAGVIDTASLLERANCPKDSLVWLVHAGERLAMDPKRPIRLSTCDVMFFETSHTVRQSAFELRAA